MSDWPEAHVYFSSVVSCQSSVASRAAISCAPIFLNTQMKNAIVMEAAQTRGACATISEAPSRLVAPESDHRINLCRPTRRQITSQQCDRRQQRGHADKD